MTTEAEKLEVNFDINSLIDRQQVAANITKKLSEEISNTVFWNVQEMVKKSVLEILEPEINSLVEAQREAIINEIIQAIPQVAKAIAENMASTAVKNLAGYSGSEIIRKIFN